MDTYITIANSKVFSINTLTAVVGDVQYGVHSIFMQDPWVIHSNMANLLRSRANIYLRKWKFTEPFWKPTWNELEVEPLTGICAIKTALEYKEPILLIGFDGGDGSTIYKDEQLISKVNALLATGEVYHLGHCQYSTKGIYEVKRP